MDQTERKGRKRPEPSEKQLKCENMQITVTSQYKQKLTDYCDSRGLTMAEFIRVTIAEKIADDGRN